MVLGTPSIWAEESIVSQEFIISHQGNLTASDRRIKKNFVDADDVYSCELRLLKPKNYEYKVLVECEERTLLKLKPQKYKEDASNLMTQLRQDVLPNIYDRWVCFKSSNVTHDRWRNTSNLESNATTLIRTKTLMVRNTTFIWKKLLMNTFIHLADWIGSVDATGNVITEITTTTVTPEEYEALEDKTGFNKNDDDTYTKTSTTAR